MIVRTPAALAARRLARVVSMLWLRIRRPAILITEQKLQMNGHPRAGYSPSIGMTYRPRSLRPGGTTTGASSSCCHRRSAP